MEYKVVKVKNSDLDIAKGRLELDVNSLLHKGWKIQGGVSISCYSAGYHNLVEFYVLTQALVRE